ncbi:uncharacterized protein LOC113302355 [Papaver somniferum]|uniref:uncharacterized protein LOC113302355 n=1 Tax=Papaver somniferum TaxID=3469 RepID=UPI000E701F78|nr:uncharacterized protein LOC113302355 [Papaver somniferum]XP_026407052.1 uncharacterized protein LOC113302355 [Papaver somniferum]XP_026407053.1 uncharacterized protein LOC113302355 [Papaver somniferum]
MLNHIIGTFSININFKNSIDNFNWIFSGVYGPCEVEERKRLWDELSLMQTIWCLPWCIGGDFNEVRIMSERKGCTRITSGMKDFGTFYEENELIDLPIAGAKYTWIKKGSNTPRSKIDRFVVNAEWDDHFYYIIVKALGRPFSDHKPIWISCDLEDWGPPPWRFESMWILEPGFMDLMQQWWDSLANSFSGPAGFVLAKKLQALKGLIKDWNKRSFGRIDRKCEKNYLEISWLDQIIDEEDITDSQLAIHDNLMLESERLADMKEMFWRDKS